MSSTAPTTPEQLEGPRTLGVGSTQKPSTGPPLSFGIHVTRTAFGPAHSTVGVPGLPGGAVVMGPAAMLFSDTPPPGPFATT
ncbi:hypothetical protein ACGFJ7_26455 [Actinoplanes sp. NPDC048988]|uniref:hypothetical protein n=1 Tax=Actinoplanes sp. NPDC048988 TaxID=3363901 RepID=UPI0037228800